MRNAWLKKPLIWRSVLRSNMANNRAPQKVAVKGKGVKEAVKKLIEAQKKAG